MRAVNLMPADSRRASGGGGGYGVYVVLAALAGLVVMLGAWALAGKQTNDRRAELHRVQAETQAAKAQIAALAPYQKFADLSQARQDTVRQLVGGRVDWAHALREIARVMPGDAKLLTLNASASPEGAAGGPGLRSAIDAPAFEITGCTTSQKRVATLMARLRAVDGVQRVSLASSEKALAPSGSATSSDCRTTSSSPQFNMTVFFRSKSAPVPQAPAGAAPGAPAGASAPAPKALQTLAPGGAK